MSFSLQKGGRLISLGCDLVDINRVREIWERQGDRFIERVFTQEERDYCLGMKHPHKHLAARFAAKEAVAKCFTTGIGEHIGWHSVSVCLGERSEPRILLDDAARDLLQRLGGTDILVTLSHTETCAMAMTAMISQTD